MRARFGCAFFLYPEDFSKFCIQKHTMGGLHFRVDDGMMQLYQMRQVRRMHPIKEFNDVYDENRCLTGKIHQRGMPWGDGEYGLVVCVWVYDGKGHFLLTRRAPGKSYSGTWENSGGAAKTGETSLQAIVRELHEETGILAAPEEFVLLDSDRDRNFFFDHYCLKRQIRLKDITLQKGETDGVMWASFGKIHWMIRTGKICKIIGRQFLRMEPKLRMHNLNKYGR